MLSVNEVLDKRLEVKPLPDNEIATYKLIQSDKDDITRTERDSGKRLKCQPSYSMKGEKRIYDPFKKKQILIRNIVGFKPVELPDGQIKEQPIVERVYFPPSGIVSVSSREQDKYAFLERCNENADNEWRDTKIKPKFYRVNTKRQAMKDLEDSYIRLDAETWVRQADQTEIETIYKGLDADHKKQVNANDFESTKRDIYRLAGKHPIMILKASSNLKAKMKVQILDAERYRIIAFDENDRSWTYIGQKPETLCEIQVGMHKIDGLVEFFINKDPNSKGKEWYKKIAEDLKLIFTAKR